MNEKMLSIEKVAKEYGVYASDVRDWIDDGLAYSLIDENKPEPVVLVSVEDIEHFLGLSDDSGVDWDYEGFRDDEVSGRVKSCLIKN